MTKKRPGSFFGRFPRDGSKMGRRWVEKAPRAGPADFRAQGPTDFRALGPDLEFFQIFGNRAFFLEI